MSASTAFTCAFRFLPCTNKRLLSGDAMPSHTQIRPSTHARTRTYIHAGTHAGRHAPEAEVRMSPGLRPAPATMFSQAAMMK